MQGEHRALLLAKGAGLLACQDLCDVIGVPGGPGAFRGENQGPTAAGEGVLGGMPDSGVREHAQI
jgi:hypothetical protein